MKKLYFRKGYQNKYHSFIAYSRKSTYWMNKNSFDENSKEQIERRFQEGKFPFIIQEAFYKFIWKR